MYIDNEWGRGDCGKRTRWVGRKIRKKNVFGMMRGGRETGRKGKNIIWKARGKGRRSKRGKRRKGKKIIGKARRKGRRSKRGKRRKGKKIIGKVRGKGRRSKRGRNKKAMNKQRRECIPAPKGQKLLAQGSALGFEESGFVRPERAKALIDVGFFIRAFAPSGRTNLP